MMDKAVIFVVEGKTDKTALENIFKKIYRHRDIQFEFTRGDITSDENITEEKVKEVEDAISDGSLHVFDTSTFTVDGKELDTYEKDGTEYVSDGYFHESEYGSAPAFDVAIDGITSITE